MTRVMGVIGLIFSVAIGLVLGWLAVWNMFILPVADLIEMAKPGADVNGVKVAIDILLMICTFWVCKVIAVITLMGVYVCGIVAAEG